MTLAGLVSQSYPSPEWAVFFEVANATGFGSSRRADAVALGIWPSRGQALIGFEFKEDRRDWLREYKNPAKADLIAAQCDRWYVVAGHDGIVKLEELPDPWGLLVANTDRTKLLTKKPAVPFPDRDTTVMKRTFIAAMLRKVTENTVPASEVERLVQEATKKAVERTREGNMIRHLEDAVERHQKTLDTFKRVTGVDLQYGWQGTEKIAAAVAAVLEGDRHRQSLEQAQKGLTQAARDIQKALDAWPAPHPDAVAVVKAS